jgi:hypothetical protein
LGLIKEKANVLEKIGPIKNPLTIIAIFAGIAEISGTAILPFIEGANQSMYVWFLMVFPIILVLLFFITLNFNHKVLYAPSDFRSDENFLKMFDKGTIKEKAAKLKQEIEEDEDTVADKSGVFGGDHRGLRRDIRYSYILAEELALGEVSLELKTKFERNVAFNLSQDDRYILDGVSVTDNTFTVVEVKYYRRNISSLSIRRSLDKIRNLFDGVLQLRPRKSCKLIFAIVTDSSDGWNRVRETAKDLIDQYTFPIDLRLYNLLELEQKYGYI